MDGDSERANWYRDRAEETRTMATEAKNPDAKEILISIAVRYVELAEIYDREAKRKRPTVSN